MVLIYETRLHVYWVECLVKKLAETLQQQWTVVAFEQVRLSDGASITSRPASIRDLIQASAINSA